MRRKHVPARLVSFAGAVALFGATVLQGVSFCLCPTAAVRVQDACPCHDCRPHDDGATAHPTDAHPVLSAPAHVCDHLALSTLPPAERTVNAGESRATTPLPLCAALAPRPSPCALSGAWRQRAGPRALPFHAPPSLTFLQRQIC
ncbi:MAG: hypothetical protein FWG50_01805 [Kiritimatiellaeota bacterium]|nr:hypothetical protein [Kiritimatiellota bacterium]